MAAAQNTTTGWVFCPALTDRVDIAAARHATGGAQRGPVAAIGMAHWPAFLSALTLAIVEV